MRINLSNLMALSEELTEKNKELNEEIASLTQIRSELKMQTALRSYQNPLKMITESLENENREMRKLIRILEESVTMYSRCEKNVVRKIEEGSAAAIPQMTVQPKKITFDSEIFSEGML